MPPRRRSLESRPGSLFRLVFLAGAILVVVLASKWWASRDRSRATPTPAAGADSVLVPLPLRRLAERPGGHLVLEAIEAAGGWDSWSAHDAVQFRLEGVFFAENGSLLESRTERCIVQFGPPLRVLIESEDGSSVTGLGPDGPWGAARSPDGRLDSGRGPGALPRTAIRRLVMEAAWVAGLPFNLGDPDAAFGEPVQAAADTLVRLPVSYNAAPGDSVGRSAILGFDPESGHILEVFYLRGEEGADAVEGADDQELTAGEPSAGRYLLSLRGYTDFRDVWLPVRRILYLTDAMGRPVRPVYEQRLSEVTWDPPVTPEMFEAPPPF